MEHATDLVWNCKCSEHGESGKLVVHFHLVDEEECSHCGALRDKRPQVIRTEVIADGEYPDHYEMALPFDQASIEQVWRGE